MPSRERRSRQKAKKLFAGNFFLQKSCRTVRGKPLSLPMDALLLHRHFFNTSAARHTYPRKERRHRCRFHVLVNRQCLFSTFFTQRYEKILCHRRKDQSGCPPFASRTDPPFPHRSPRAINTTFLKFYFLS